MNFQWLLCNNIRILLSQGISYWNLTTAWSHINHISVWVRPGLPLSSLCIRHSLKNFIYTIANSSIGKAYPLCSFEILALPWLQKNAPGILYSASQSKFSSNSFPDTSNQTEFEVPSECLRFETPVTQIAVAWRCRIESLTRKMAEQSRKERIISHSFEYFGYSFHYQNANNCLKFESRWEMKWEIG